MPEPINYMAMVPQPNLSQDVAGGLALGVFSAVCGVVGNLIFTWFTNPHH